MLVVKVKMMVTVVFMGRVAICGSSSSSSF